MRKDRHAPLTAADVLNSFSEAKLADIFARYGEVAEAGRLAKKIIEKRLFTPLQSTVQLRLLVEEVTHWRPRPGLVHPAAKVFQALRIFINHELDGIESWLEKIPLHLRAGGRVVFITYHSLEDRLVKKGFQRLQQQKVELLRPFPGFPRRRGIGPRTWLRVRRNCGRWKWHEQTKKSLADFRLAILAFFIFIVLFIYSSLNLKNVDLGYQQHELLQQEKKMRAGDRSLAGAKSSAAEPGAHGKDRHGKTGLPVSRSRQIIKVVDNDMKINTRAKNGSFVLAIFFFIWIFFIAFKLFKLQVIDYNTYMAKVKAQINRVEDLHSKRGTITDRNGEILAISLQSKSAFLSNKDKEISLAVFRDFCRLLALDNSQKIKGE